ncbi:hypothetical protein PFISCL1PPCAC_10104, partial [Pristionchus fissidentatus]
AEELVLGVLLDGGQHRLVDDLLVGLALLANLVLLMSRGEDVGLLALLLNLGVSSLEVRVGQGVGDLDSADVNLGGGGNDERLSDSSEGNVVQLVGSGDQQEASLLKLLEEDNALSLMSASEDDQDSSGSDGLSQRLNLGVSADLGGNVKDVVLLHEDGLYTSEHLALSTVLGATDLLGDELVSRSNGLLGDLGLLAESNSTLVVHAGGREAHKPGSELIVAPESGRSLLGT